MEWLLAGYILKWRVGFDAGMKNEFETVMN